MNLIFYILILIFSKESIMKGRLFLAIIIITEIIQIVSLVKLKKTNNSNYWNRIVGITIANLISTAIAYFTFENCALGLGDAIASLIICGFSLISNLIITITASIIKKSTKNNNIKLNKRSFPAFSITLLLNIIALIVIPMIMIYIIVNVNEKKVVTYLENKYGITNYEIVNIYEGYETDGMWDKYLSDYYYEIKCDYMNNTFIVAVDANSNYIEDDYFLPVYYSQKYNLNYNLKYDDWDKSIDYDFSEFNEFINNNIEKKYSINNSKIDTMIIYKDYIESTSNIYGVKYSDGYYIVPIDNKKIPSFDELVDLLFKYTENADSKKYTKDTDIKKDTEYKDNKTKLIENKDYFINEEFTGKYLDITKRGYYVDTLNQPDAPYYYIICMGEQSTGGYSLKIKEVNKIGNTTEIIVKEISPSKDANVTMALTHPTLVVEFPKYQENIIIKNTNEKEFTELMSY